MTLTQAISAVVSAIVQDREWAEVWVNTDSNRVRDIDNAVQLSVQNNPDAFVMPQDPSQLAPNLICFAQNKDMKYYRCRIKHILAQLVYVQSIDHGVEFCTDFRTLKLFRGDDPFKDVEPAAEKYYIAGILLTGQLTREELDSMNIVKNHVLLSVVAVNKDTNTRLATIFLNGFDYSDVWKRLDKVQSLDVNLQNQMISQHHHQRLHESLKLPASTAMRLPLPSQLPAVPLQRRTLSSPHSGIPGLRQPVASPPLVATTTRQTPITPLPTPTPTPTPALRDTRYHPPPHKVLMVGATCNIVVSDATNGPWSFSVQLENEREALQQVTEDMQRVDKVPIRPPLTIGRPCIVFHPIQKVYARAMLISEGDRSGTVAFIDFGDSDVVNIREIFEIPQQGLVTHQLSQKFRLATMPPLKPGSEDYNQLITVFQKVVRNVELLLVVTRTEEGCSQNCELFNMAGTSIKSVMNVEKKKLNMAYASDDLPAVGDTLPVFISHVNSSDNFYLQKKVRSVECDALQDELQKFGSEAASLDQFRINMPCLAMFSEDGLWYRASIASEPKQNKATVFFVDYGNEMLADIHRLKEVSKKLAKVPTLAIACSLDGKLPDERKLRALLNDDNVEAKVVDAKNNRIVVKLLHSGVDITAVKPLASPPAIHKVAAPLHAENEGWNGNSMSHWHNENPPRRRKESMPRRDYRQNAIQDRFARLDQLRRLPDHGGENNKPNGYANNMSNGEANFHNERNQGGYRNRQDNDGGFRKRRDDGGAESGSWRRNDVNDSRKFGDSEGGGFRKTRDDAAGGYQNHGDSERSGFRNRGSDDGGGFRKRRDDNDGSGGFNSRPDRPMRTPIRYDERAAPGSEWMEESIEPGTEWDVQVTYFVTPEDFYVQSINNRDAFVAMVEGIQTDYSNKFGFKKTEPPQVSDIVVAKFSEDRVLYRGQVTVAEPLTVRFVDYGNVDTVTDGRNVYPVMSKLLDLPKQAIRCRLDGIQRAGESWSTDVDSYFDKEQLKCTFLSVEDGVHRVKLTCNGEDVAGQLRAAGLAADAGVPTVAGVAPLITAEVNDSDATQIAHILPKLLKGDRAFMNIPYIEGVNNFFVQPDPVSVSVMEGLIANTPLNPLSINEQHIGSLCIAGLNDVKYRGHIAELTEVGAWVHFIDYGDSSDIPLTEIFEIPDSLKSYPALAISCDLYGDTSGVPDEAQDKFKEEFEQKDIVIYIHSVTDNRLIVTPYDVRGVKVNIEGWVNEQPGVSDIPQLVLPASEMTVNVLELTSSNTCLITLPSLTQPDMNVFYTDLDDSLQVEVGCRCAVKCADGNWRRTVRAADGECYLLDVGRSEVATEFRPLAPPFVPLPAVVREVSCTWPILGTQRVKVTRDEAAIAIEPICKSVYVSHVESATEIYVQMESVVQKVEEISAALLEMAPAEVDVATKVFAAKFPDDEQWYRAEVINMLEPKKVRFIDYGNCSDVTEVAPLPPNLQLPPLAKRIELEGIPQSAFHELLSLTESESALKLVEEAGKITDVLKNNISIFDKILKRRPLKSGDEVFICHVESTAHFYVHRKDDFQLIESITVKLESSPTFALPESPVNGMMVAAKYVDYDAWYRAIIEDEEVWFTDHGNRAPLLEIRELPTELSEVPPVAVRLCIEHPTGDEWPQSSTDAMYALMDRPLTVVKAVWRGNCYVVTLFHEGEDVINHLKQEMTGAVNTDAELPDTPVICSDDQLNDNDYPAENAVNDDEDGEVKTEEHQADNPQSENEIITDSCDLVANSEEKVCQESVHDPNADSREENVHEPNADACDLVASSVFSAELTTHAEDFGETDTALNNAVINPLEKIHSKESSYDKIAESKEPVGSTGDTLIDENVIDTSVELIDVSTEEVHVAECSVSLEDTVTAEEQTSDSAMVSDKNSDMLNNTLNEENIEEIEEERNDSLVTTNDANIVNTKNDVCDSPSDPISDDVDGSLSPSSDLNKDLTQGEVVLTTPVAAAVLRAEEKIVPGAICRGVDFNNMSP